MKRCIFSDKATALKLCTAGNVNSIVQYNLIALRVHQLRIIETLLTLMVAHTLLLANA